MCICIYVYIYICTSIHIYVHIDRDLNIYIYTYHSSIGFVTRWFTPFRKSPSEVRQGRGSAFVDVGCCPNPIQSESPKLLGFRVPG